MYVRVCTHMHTFRVCCANGFVLFATAYLFLLLLLLLLLLWERALIIDFYFAVSVVFLHLSSHKYVLCSLNVIIAGEEGVDAPPLMFSPFILFNSERHFFGSGIKMNEAHTHSRRALALCWF